MSTAPEGSPPQRQGSFLWSVGSFCGICALAAGFAYDTGLSEPLVRSRPWLPPLPSLAALLAPAVYLTYRAVGAAAQRAKTVGRREPKIAAATVVLTAALVFAVVAKAQSSPMSPARLVGPASYFDIPGDASILDAHVTLPPGSDVAGGTKQVKIFRLRNSGTVDWTGRLLCRADPEMNGPGNLRTPECVSLPHTPAGETVDVRVRVKVANRDGTQVATFKMSDGRRSWYYRDAAPVRIELDVTAQAKD